MKDKSGFFIVLISFLMPVTVFTMYLLAYFPGIMTPDSIFQWEQIVSLKFDDWHPVMHTVFELLLTKIWFSPASIAIAQMIALALVFCYGVHTLQRLGVNKLVLLLTIILFSLYPANGFMTVTLWKDILYSTMLMWMTIILINIIAAKGLWIKSRRNAAFFFINSLGVVFFRHNGILTFLAVIALLLIAFRKYYKSWLLLLALVVGINFIVTGPVYKMMKVREGSATEAMGVPMQQIAAVVKFNGTMSDQQRDFISKILPMEVWANSYHPYITNPLKFHEKFDADFLLSHKGEFVLNWASIVKQNPEISLLAYKKITSMIWRVHPYDDSFTFTVVPGIYENKLGLKEDIKSAGLRAQGDRILNYTNEKKPLVYFWRPALWLYTALICTLLFALRTNWRSLIAAGPILSNTLAFMIAIPSQDYRYLYANVLIAAMLLPLAASLIFKSWRNI